MRATYDGGRGIGLVLVHALLGADLTLLHGLLKAGAERGEARVGEDLVLHERTDQVEQCGVVNAIKPLGDRRA